MIPARRLNLLAGLLVLLLARPALAKKPLGPGERVDLNRATAAELTRLPGVGKKRAEDIVAHRARQPFRRPEDVLRVKGLGRAWFGRVRHHLVAGEPTRSPAPAAPQKR